MDTLYQLFLLIIAVTYKYLLTKENIWGWILGATSSVFSAFYDFYYLNIFVVTILEITFVLLSIYGIYKHIEKNKLLTKVDFSIIGLAIIAITYIAVLQIKKDTIWYEILGSISFLSGVIFLAQKNMISNVVGWCLFFSGSICIGAIMIERGVWILVLLHVISLFICVRAIIRIIRFSK